MISLSKVISVALTEEGETNCRREALYCLYSCIIKQLGMHISSPTSIWNDVMNINYTLCRVTLHTLNQWTGGGHLNYKPHQLSYVVGVLLMLHFLLSSFVIHILILLF